MKDFIDIINFKQVIVILKFTKMYSLIIDHFLFSHLLARSKEDFNDIIFYEIVFRFKMLNQGSILIHLLNPTIQNRVKYFY